MDNKQKIKCLFGHHEWGALYGTYRANTQPNKNGDVIISANFAIVHDCQICGTQELVDTTYPYFSINLSHDKCDSSNYYNE